MAVRTDPRYKLEDRFLVFEYRGIEFIGGHWAANKGSKLQFPDANRWYVLTEQERKALIEQDGLTRGDWQLTDHYIPKTLAEAIINYPGRKEAAIREGMI